MISTSSDNCVDCGEPLVCHCGDYVKGHGYSTGHGAVPVDCQACHENLERRAREVLNKLVSEQKQMDPEIASIIDEEFWTLVTR